MGRSVHDDGIINPKNVVSSIQSQVINVYPAFYFFLFVVFFSFPVHKKKDKDKMTRKIDAEHDCFIDNWMISLCEYSLPFCIQWNIQPNDLTCLRFFLLQIAFFFLCCTTHIILPLILIVLFYFLDCLDGHLARSTNQITRFGDFMDHSVDLLYAYFFFCFLYLHSYFGRFWLLCFFFIFFFGCLLHITLQQFLFEDVKNNQKNSPIVHLPFETLDFLQPWLKKWGWTSQQCQYWMKFTKYVSCGMFFLFFLFSILWVQTMKRLNL